MVAAIVTAAETAMEAAGMAARGATAVETATAAAADMDADRPVRATGAAAAVATGDLAPGPTPHVSLCTDINFIIKDIILVVLYV